MRNLVLVNTCAFRECWERLSFKNMLIHRYRICRYTTTNRNTSEDDCNFQVPEFVPWEGACLWLWQICWYCLSAQSSLHLFHEHFWQIQTVACSPFVFSLLLVYFLLPTKYEYRWKYNVTRNTNTFCLSCCLLSFSCFHHFLSSSHFSCSWLGMTSSEMGTENQDVWESYSDVCTRLDACYQFRNNAPRLVHKWET